MTTAATGRFMEFVEKVSRDRNLTLQLSGIHPGDNAAIAAMAASQGYNFTIAELEEAARETRKTFKSEGEELSDEELEGISGGLLVCIAIIAILIG